MERLAVWVWNQLNRDTDSNIPLNRVNAALRVVSAVAPREIVALELRAGGMRYSEIGREMGVSRQRAQQIVAGALDRVRRICAIPLRGTEISQIAATVEETCSSS